MANIITELHLEMSSNWYVTKKLNSVGRVGENTVTKLIIEPTKILDNVTYEIEIMSADGSKNVAELTIDGTELYLILTANMLTTSGIAKMQVRGLFTDGSIKKSNIFELKVNRSISATEHYEEYAVTIFDQLVQECRDVAEGAESYAIRAETAAVNAEAYEQSASASAEAASGYADNASNYADNASTSAANAATSETNASTSATNAHTSETNAAASASSASTSASNASASATNAANSATSAATSATNAHNSEVNASTSETNASTSATEAAASAESIAASVAQINENTYRINDLEAIIGGYQLADLPTGAVASVTDGTALLMPSLKVGIEPVQSGSGDPSPDNIRPIEGWTAANVTRTGKNLFGGIDFANAIKDSSPSGNIDYENETVQYSYGTGDKTTIYDNFKPNTSYTFLFKVADCGGQNFSMRIAYTDGTVEGIEVLPSDIGNYVRKVSKPNKTVSKLAVMWYQSTLVKLYYDECGIFEGALTVQDFEPYNGQTYNIQFKDGDNPLTVYGGTLDVTSGVLTVTDAYIASYNAETLPSTWISDRDVYAEGATPTTGAEVVYKLANSVTYHLTPTQIRTLVGNNNIWVDAGDIISGKYYKSPN